MKLNFIIKGTKEFLLVDDTDFNALDRLEKEAIYADITELLYEKLCEGSVTIKDMMLDTLITEVLNTNADTGELIQECEWII